MRGKVTIAIVVTAAFLAGILFTTAGANVFNMGDAVGTETRAASLPVADESGPVSLDEAFIAVADKVNPAVVQIQAEVVREARGRSPFEGTPFEDFFGGGPGGNPVPRDALGSGVITQSDGYIVTNNHVVEDAQELTVVTFDGQRLDAEIVGTDAFSDLAVIKVDATGLPTVPFSDSDDLKVGQWVMAFGSPLSEMLSNTATAGIVSAVGRLQSGPSNTGIRDFVQSDAAINPGNSGGPLVNLRGQIVGINTAIASRTGGYQGIGFAIPANTVRDVAEQLIETGEVTRAFLGINYAPASNTLVQAEDLPAGAAVVASVVDGSPAAEAGFQSGDIIVAVGGEELTNYLQVGQKISRLKPGEEITITVDRDGERVELTPTLVERDDEATASNNRRGNEDDGSSRREMMEELGFTYQEITPSIARQLELDDTDGVVIANVNPASDAYREAGLRRGMVVERVDGQEVTSVADFEDAYASVEAGEAFRMRLRLPDGSVVVTALRKPTSGS